MSRFFGVCALLLCAASAAAQTPAASATTAASSANAVQTSGAQASGGEVVIHPATTTFFGDTGMWFVPTAEVLPHGKWSVSGYRRGTNYQQGFTNVGDFAGTFAYGFRDRFEVFGSMLFDTRIDRDLRPLFTSNNEVGGIVERHPRVHEGWTGDNFGDTYIGGKMGLLPVGPRRQSNLAIRGLFKLPTGDEDSGASNGQMDFSIDAVASTRRSRGLQIAAYGGFEVRGEPDGLDTPGSAFRWGLGATTSPQRPFRASVELDGTVPTGDDASGVIGIVGDDGSVPPPLSDVQSLTRFTTSLTWQHANGFFIGGGVSWNFPGASRDGFLTDGDPSVDSGDWQVRIGFHPGARRALPAPILAPLAPPPPATPPPAAPAAAPPPAAANRAPTVTAACNPCTVEVGATSTLTATANDPDANPITYRWTAPSGALATPAERVTQWSAPQQEGPVEMTVAVDDGRGGTATARTTVTVTRAPVRSFTFEDVMFDFDRFTLRPEALRILDGAVTTLQQNPTLRLMIEGHTCNIGTAEYNLALGDRRANAVRTYLLNRGIAADRLQSISYGEERPKYDNAREETRRLNRRAALVVNVVR